ncbi:unnamed protein product [Wuchereria bancrofti]|uniref:MUN domain-containing protein n=1 Tax=Wuchereria bancrofti TaxID=6293 RepID=A0A3P7FZU7_WUCBA|nr:unnamed protein product [Wuchereria bancrofti]
MDCPNPEVYADMMKRFSKTLNKVLLAYADMVQKDFNKFVNDEKLACILMNNVQQLRYADNLIDLIPKVVLII